MGDGQPLIGVSAYLEQARYLAWEQRYALLPETYLLAAQQAGGIPVLLPPQPFDDAVVARVLDAIDGLVLSGGPDVDPALYGAEREERTQEPRHDRDAWERALALAALDRDMPVLAICRGVQLLNAVLGGTLVQHLPEVSDADHGHAPGVFARTDVEIVAGTEVRRVLGAIGDRLSVHCHHHQALRDVAPGLVVAARSDDGVVEAVESPAHRFAIGVQWHPEQDAADRRLFAALVGAAQQSVRVSGRPAVPAVLNDEPTGAGRG